MDSLKPKQKINRIRLIEVVWKMDSHRKRKYWKCYCIRCGRIFEVREDSLKTGRQFTCGCYGKHKRHLWLLKHKEV